MISRELFEIYKKEIFPRTYTPKMEEYISELCSREILSTLNVNVGILDEMVYIDVGHRKDFVCDYDEDEEFYVSDFTKGTHDFRVFTEIKEVVDFLEERMKFLKQIEIVQSI